MHETLEIVLLLITGASPSPSLSFPFCRISPSLFHTVTSNMADYLTIPGQRLAVLAERCRGKELASSLLHHVSTDARLLESEQGSKVIQGITEKERKRQLRFSIEMDRLTAKRASLALDLTHTLTHIEKKAGVFLIKPIYARQPRGMGGVGGGLRALITPIDRPLPLQQKPHPSSTSQSRPHTSGRGGGTSRCGTPHPSMRLVGQLVKARQMQQSQTQWQSELLSFFVVWPATPLQIKMSPTASFFTCTDTCSYIVSLC